tara:strand:- start:22006 stop:23166 length:1161 start_codon:yes stop_codon:yes gene_type:complete
MDVFSPRLLLILLTCAGRVHGAAPGDWWSLADVPAVDVRALAEAGLDDACIQVIQTRLADSSGGASQLLDGAKLLQSVAAADAVYTAAERALDFHDRDGAHRCVEYGDCAWVHAPLVRTCTRAPDAGLLQRVFAAPRLASWGLRAFSAFFLPEAAPRRLGLLSGDDAAPASPALVLPVDASATIASYALRLQEALQHLTAATGQSPSFPKLPSLQALLARRRLGLWSTPAFPSQMDDAVQRFVRSVRTLHTDADRAAAEGALSAVRRAMTQFATTLYLELPMDKKMLIAKIARKDEGAVHSMLAYLKGTGLARTIQKRFAFDHSETADALAYAAGDASRFERVAAAYARRIPASARERAAAVELLRAAEPAARALGVGVAWLQTFA